MENLKEDSKSTFADIRNKLSIMQTKLDDFSAPMQQLISSVSAINDEIEKFKTKNYPLSNSIQNVGDSHSLPVSCSFDRSTNIIIYGIKENVDPTVWREEVDHVLHFLLNKSVDVNDSFRLGRYIQNSNRDRPVLVKLASTWVKRLILSKRSNLRNYSQSGIFIAPDEPLDVRRKQTMQRLKFRAERSNLSTSIINDTLYISNVATYSLVNGMIGGGHGSSTISNVQIQDSNFVSNTNHHNVPDGNLSSVHDPHLQNVSHFEPL